VSGVEGSARIDAHQHFWDLSSGAYAWPTADDAAIFRSFGPADLGPELGAAGIDATVVVQAIDTLGDTDAMIAAAEANPWIVGVVGWAPLLDARAAEAAIEDRRGRGICGIRHLIHREPDPEWLVRAEVGAGLRLLERLGLPLDVVAVFPDHLRLVPIVADRHPDLTFVIDHLAKPPIRGDGWPRWRRELVAAAERPNVVAKLSGLDTAAGAGWTADELRPSVEVAIDAFGPDRLLFGSDWPVCRLVSRYANVVVATKRLIQRLSMAEQDAILGGTARRVYRLA
jgi:L-fuconolactonase